MDRPHVDIRWLPIHHSARFARLGPHCLWLLLALVRPQNSQEAEPSQYEIQLRLFLFHWVLYSRMGASRRPLFRRQVLALGYSLSPWSEPTIHDVGDALEFLIRHCASPSLVTAMGKELENWPEDPMGHVAHEESDEE